MKRAQARQQGWFCLVLFAVALTLLLSGCASVPDEAQTDPRGASPSGRSEQQLIRETLDQTVNIPEADVNVDVPEQPAD